MFQVLVAVSVLECMQHLIALRFLTSFIDQLVMLLWLWPCCIDGACSDVQIECQHHYGMLSRLRVQ